MDLQEHVELLSGVDIFESLSEEEIREILDDLLQRSAEFTLEVVDAGTVFGEVAFTPHAFRQSYAEAMEPSVVFAMERAEVERLILQKPKVGIRIISLLSERLHYYETRMQDVTLKEVPARLASLILFLVKSEGVHRPGEIRIPTS